MADLVPTDVATAVTMVESGATYRSVGRILGVSVFVVHRNVQRFRLEMRKFTLTRNPTRPNPNYGRVSG